MKKATLLHKLAVAAFALFLTAAASRDALAAATIVIQNNDAAGQGFNDPTPVSPVGGNTGTTLGQQRLNAFQFAANIWGATLNSGPTIVIRASWSSTLSCSANAGTLGAANAATSFRGFANAPFANTLYPVALANALAGADLNNANPEINAQFNSNLGNTGCLEGKPFYLGLDGNHGSGIDLVAVLMHEFGHGLGFLTFTNSSTGAQAGGFPFIYDRFLVDNTTEKAWVEMTDAERQASAVNTGHLVWKGQNVVSDARLVLATPRLKVNSPGPAAYAVVMADFGGRLSSAGVTANVAQASPADACTALANASAVAGRIALIDRGGCNFDVKVKNAQDAGAVGVVVVNNVAGAPITMGSATAGLASAITVPAMMVSQADGATLKSQLASGLNATMLLDTAVPSGTDAQGRPLMFAPNPVSGGSSVSHWDTSLFPNQLMEPNNTADIIHTVSLASDLTGSLMRDIGWKYNPIGDMNFFVRQHYLDFLNREPDASGLDFWRENVLGCGLDRACAEVKQINTSAAFFLSIEFQGTGNLVYNMYKTGFGNVAGTPVPVRRADFVNDSRQIQSTPAQVIVGQGAWQAQLEANKQAFALAFVQRPAFQAAHAGQDAATFVDSLFANAGAQPTAGERAAAVSAFGGGAAAGMAAALRSVAESASVTAATKNESFVLMQYFGYLQRDPDAVGFDGQPDPTFSGYSFWLGKLNQFGGNFVQAQMVKAFIDSIEYRQRFGPA
ncbi:MAG TPA: PA domain-containing protein [Pyrinomonadaceae bacterium]|jgi:hypothetical protein